ncbi:MAG TPA: family 78 glycoside hydrolase catalytic domain [Ignavibacteriales bacterium]|nr:family 78 glycoside hydrolase catalytic domain [Ignavibacteriales bacterium]
MNYIFAVISYFSFFLLTASYGASAKLADLKCDHLVNPLGIDNKQPLFTWRLEDSRSGAVQTYYQFSVGTDSAGVAAGNGDMWKVKKTRSSENFLIYKGKPLAPFTKYFWRVAVWDKDGRKILSDIAGFETGMMSASNWKGSWISDNMDINLKPAPYFRKVFNAAKKIKSARAYIAAAGLYELYLNGEKISDHRLDPMYVNYDKRVLYVAHDVTSQLRSGSNAIGVLLGNGWYNHQSIAVWDFHKAPWRARPAFCLDIRITYEDGSVEVVSSGKDWKTSLSPVIFNSIYTAEHYDARLEQPGWNTAAFNDSSWSGVIYRSAPAQNIVSQMMHPIRNVEEIPAVKVTKFSDTDYVFDIGRNIAGVTKFTVNGEAGTVIRLKHGERLYKDGHVDMSNIDVHYRPTDDTDPFQTDIIILSGKGEETFMPHFNYKGFQYIEVTSSKPLELTKENLTGYFMRSDVPSMGEVKSSNPTLDKIWKAANNSYLSNLFGYPTDCPQREKNGWTGDAHIASETGLYSFDAVTIYEKWMADHRDEQQPNGVLPAIIPSNGWGYEWGNGPDWTSTIAIIPWNLYLFYGDARVLAECYPNIKRYVDHITEISSGELTSWGLGDWVPVTSKTPVEFTSSIYYYVDASILANAAKMFGEFDDYEKYSALAGKIKAAINDKYLNKETGIYGSGYQTELSAALYWGIVPEELKAKVAANLAKRVEADNYHLDVGLLGTKSILNALSENGYADIAYNVAAQETYPSWGWWIVNGATTLYENWDIESKYDISLNHIMFGEIGAWIYKALGGIKPDPSQPGFKNVILEPHFVPGLENFEASHIGPYGKIISSWKREGEKIFYNVTVPANSTAAVLLEVPAGKNVYEGGKLLNTSSELISLIPAGNKTRYDVKPGTYNFEIR